MPTASTTVPQPLMRIDNQPRVRAFLSAAYAEGRLSHAYLFTGMPGAGMTEAALALAQCVVCPNPEGPDGTCDECLRVAHHTHPDVQFLSPGGVHGYLIDQVRTLEEEVAYAPVRATRKVYVLDRADQLRGASANALLKTLEEPPAHVMFILIARSADAMLPTIVSRCQQVPFRVVPPQVAVASIAQRVGGEERDARIALSVTGTPEMACEFLQSPDRRNVRRTMVRTLCELADDDAWDVLVAAQGLVEDAQVASGLRQRGKSTPKRDAIVRDEAKRRTEGQEDYYTPAMLKRLEDVVRRELSARERSAMIEALAAAESFLRDVLLCCEGALEPIVNEDVSAAVERIAHSATTSGVLRALESCRAAASDIAHNVTPQLALEVMLLSVKEALEWQPSYR
ncbi:MAG: DNA polymerase III subunit delta' [Atopobiaceae bacterium]|nr:DNA polymerase III subunit delta' [Atopobiaceae bacterium]